MAHKWKGRERIERTEWKRIHDSWYLLVRPWIYLNQSFKLLMTYILLFRYEKKEKEKKKRRWLLDLVWWNSASFWIFEVWCVSKFYLLQVLYVLSLWFVCAKPYFKFCGCSSFWIFDFDCSNTSSKLCRLVPFLFRALVNCNIICLQFFN